MTLFCIADKKSALGFKLAGLETREVSNRLQTLEALKVATATENVGIILITEKAASFIRAEVEEFGPSHELPLLLEIPSRDSEAKVQSAQEFLREAIGITL